MYQTSTHHESIPGLNLRIALANARVLAKIDPQRGEEHVWDVYFEVEGLGYQAFKDGSYCAPEMVVSDSTLYAAWRSGFKQAQRHREIDDCHQCSALFGDACRVHG